MDNLALWENVPTLSVNEFMCLLFGLEPGAVKFDYGDQKSWPQEAVPVYRLLAADIRSKKLKVFFENAQDDPFIGPYADVRESHYFHTGEPWWEAGKLYKSQLVEWLEEKGISSDFFNATKVETSTRTSTPQPKNKSHKHRAVPAPAAAVIVGVSERQIRNWDKGVNMPDNYPGRDDEIALQMFANRYRARKVMLAQARAMRRAASGGDLSDRFTKSAFDET